MTPGDSLRRLREAKPLVHQITNYVVMNETANATLALGALPVMAHAREEVEEMAALAGALVRRLFPLATVVTPNLAEAQALTGTQTALKAELAERLVEFGAAAAIVTGGHGDPVDHLFDGTRHVAIPVERLAVASTHGAGCTHSATLAALLARGLPLEDAARGASRAATDAVRHGLAELGAGDGPVDILNVKGRA